MLISLGLNSLPGSCGLSTSVRVVILGAKMKCPFLSSGILNLISYQFCMFGPISSALFPEGRKVSNNFLMEFVLSNTFVDNQILLHLSKCSTLCCISLGRCCFGLETRVIIKISKNPSKYPINVE